MGDIASRAEPRVPVELFTNILVHLSYQKAVLCRLARVCKTWAAIVQPWIYHRITLDAEWPPFKGLQNAQNIFANSSHLMKFVRKLVLSPKSSEKHYSEYNRNKHNSLRLDVIFFRALHDRGILKSLAFLTTLEINHPLLLGPGQEEEMLKALSDVSHITCLSLRDIRFRSLGVPHIRKTFPSLRSFSIDCVHFTDDNFLSAPPLDRVAICVTPVASPSDLFPRFPPFHDPPFRHLTLGWTNDVFGALFPLSFAHELLYSVPTTLESLTLSGEYSSFDGRGELRLKLDHILR
jgi:hypothetical protein